MSPSITKEGNSNMETTSWSNMDQRHSFSNNLESGPPFQRSFVNGNPSATTSSARVSNDRNEFTITVETEGFRPEDLKVTTLGDNVLKVEGNHSEQEGESHLTRQFSRTYTLPSDCNIGHMTSSFAGGKLCVKVPKKHQPALEHWGSQSRRDVPIRVSGSPKVHEVKINAQTGKAKDDWMKADDFWTSDKSFGSPGWMKPVSLFNHDDVFQNWNSTNGWNVANVSNQSQDVETSETDEKFTFSLNIDGYEPKDLKVSVLDDVLKIEGKHEEEVSDNANKKSLSKQFVRSYVLPRSVYNMNRVESSLTKNGKLVVTVPKHEPRRHDSRAINIPIRSIQ